MFKIFHREKKKKKTCDRKSTEERMSSRVHKTFDKKKKTTDFENYICLFKKHTKGLVIEG